MFWRAEFCKMETVVAYDAKFGIGSLTTADGLKLACYVDDFTDPWGKPDTVVLNAWTKVG